MLRRRNVLSQTKSPGGNPMRRALLFAVPLLALSLTGCPSKPKDGSCKSSEDCAEQEGFGKVCVEGRCEECGQDTDCKAGFVCRQNKCVPRPECEKGSDCPAGQTCEAGRCVAQAPASSCAPGGKYEAVHFDFDKSLIRAGDAQILEKDAACIKELTPARVTLAGHCA